MFKSLVEPLIKEAGAVVLKLVFRAGNVLINKWQRIRKK